MNKTYNQDNELIPCIAEDGSHIRNKTVYNNTMNRLINEIWNSFFNGGIERHCDHKDLENILEYDNIPKEIWTNLIKTAYFYFEREKQENRNNNE